MGLDSILGLPLKPSGNAFFFLVVVKVGHVPGAGDILPPRSSKICKSLATLEERREIGARS